MVFAWCMYVLSWKPMLWLLESSPKMPPPLRMTTCMKRRSASCDVTYLVRGRVGVRVRVRVRGRGQG